jgi:hypothetical protein
VRSSIVVRFARPRVDAALATTYVNPISGNIEEPGDSRDRAPDH